MLTCVICGGETERGMQCACCRTGDCEHRRAQKTHVAKMVGDPLADAARELNGDAFNYTTNSPDERHVSEAERQEEIRRALIAAGFSVYRIGQRDARGTQDPGVPDLYAMHRQHGAIWVECKRPHGGVLSRAQLEFREACYDAGQAYVVASQVSDLAQWLYPSEAA